MLEGNARKTGPAPCSADEAVSRAQALLVDPSNRQIGYQLGTGDYRPGATDLPWTQAENGLFGCDCAGFVVWCFKLPRHRPGYNRGGKFDVEDDLNTNSMLGDAFGARELFAPVDGVPLPGDIIAYPTFRLRSHDDPSKLLTFIGHTGQVIGVSRWDGSTYGSLDIVQVHGPNGRMPAAVATDGAVFDRHNATWPKPEHRASLLRAI